MEALLDLEVGGIRSSSSNISSCPGKTLVQDHLAWFQPHFQPHLNFFNLQIFLSSLTSTTKLPNSQSQQPHTMGTGKKEANRKIRQGKVGDGMANVKTKGENFYRLVISRVDQKEVANKVEVLRRKSKP